MALVMPSPLSKVQQALVDRICQWILIEWPGMFYGKFESSCGAYKVTFQTTGSETKSADAFAFWDNDEDAVYDDDGDDKFE
jgi:hypothetical protein